MIYSSLAKFYDALVGNEAATKQWVDFTIHHQQGNNILDMACGSGDIAIALTKCGFKVDACDLSEAMLKHAQSKMGSEAIHFFVMDMSKPCFLKNYDTITCYCDSLNYLIEDNQILNLFQAVYKALNNSGTFLFDIHSLDRIDEFKDEFYEEGTLNDLQYEWSILSDDDLLYQNFIFFDANAHRQMEQHIQRVYNPTWIYQQLVNIGFKVEIYTDFIQAGIQSGEKIFFVAKKEMQR